MPSHVKTYNESGDPKDHLKLFQSAAKTEGWVMPTWCHMFNSTLTGNARVWFDKLPKESIDSYKDLRTAFRENYLQQTKATSRIPGRYITSSKEMENLRRLPWEINPPWVIKSLMKEFRGLMDEMYRMTTSFLQGEVAAFSHGQRKASSSWKQSEGGNKPNFKKGFKNKQKNGTVRRKDSTPHKSPKENFRTGKRSSASNHNGNPLWKKGIQTNTANFIRIRDTAQMSACS
ncbi:reverse transcriptase domain-containing protein [Tanacetum coccineum]